jgi:hypothetical protein
MRPPSRKMPCVALELWHCRRRLTKSEASHLQDDATQCDKTLNIRASGQDES